VDQTEAARARETAAHTW